MRLFLLIVSLALVSPVMAQHRFAIQDGSTVLFLGDSITHAGHYIEVIEAQLRTRGVDAELINLGLPSETCSGLSEPKHPFPRPNVHERVERALKRIKPDAVFVCYGMNDGIYYPPSTERFAAYQSGVNSLIRKIKATGAQLVMMTPPAFDAQPLRDQGKLLPRGAGEYSWTNIYEDYDDVLAGYAGWIRKQSDRVDAVIDLHTPVNEYVREKRKSNPKFSMSPDGVHVNQEGHQVLAAAIMDQLGIDRVRVQPKMMELVTQRQRVLHAAWVSEVGHKRPGVKAGLPIDEALNRADEIDRLIAELK